MSPWLVVALLLSSSRLVRVASYSLTMRPDHLRTSENPETVTFTCTADSALTGCQFRWWDRSYKAGTLLDLSRGSLSRANSTHLDSKLTGYSYSGRGLGAGDCGVSLQVVGYKEWMVGCRVRAETGGWTYAWADLYATELDPLPNTRTPRESVVLPGGEARVALKVQEPLGWCSFHPPGFRLAFKRGAQSDDSAGRHRYLGGGLGGGDCGLALSDVSEADNGPVGCLVASSVSPHKTDYRFMALIVANPPSPPALSVVYTDASVTATCEVHEGRPVANMSWVLGDDVVRQDSLDDSPATAQDEWRWPWTKRSILQTLTLKLQAEDSGKVLKCVVSHVALAQPLEASKIISSTEPVSDTIPVVSTSTTASPTVATSTTPPATASTTASPTVETSISPPATASTTASPTVQTSTASPCTCHNPSLGPTPDPFCTATSTLDLLCREYRVRASQLGDTCCPGDKVHELRVREAGAAARTAELAEEQAKVTLEAAKSSARAEEARARADELTRAALATVTLEQAKVTLEAAKVTLEAAKSSARAEEARARKEEALAKNAEEELSFGRARRS